MKEKYLFYSIKELVRINKEYYIEIRKLQFSPTNVSVRTERKSRERPHHRANHSSVQCDHKQQSDNLFFDINIVLLFDFFFLAIYHLKSV